MSDRSPFFQVRPLAHVYGNGFYIIATAESRLPVLFHTLTMAAATSGHCEAGLLNLPVKPGGKDFFDRSADVGDDADAELPDAGEQLARYSATDEPLDAQLNEPRGPTRRISWGQGDFETGGDLAVINVNQQKRA